MEKRLRNTVITESLWLLGLLLVAAVVEYSIIEIFDLHPVLSVKIQGFIGLLLIAYSIRMASRLWKSFKAQELDKTD
ncbi:MAG: hypothetical protein GVY20_11540 [Bacteroidetes bacterium]|jgi:hypothetical protein|nr:hypothetical protein [Bacteroidota bacterium]